jgi:hypothetical protein
MGGVIHFASEVITFGAENPADDAVVDGHADEGAKHLGEEDRSGRDVHVMADFHVLKL